MHKWWSGFNDQNGWIGNLPICDSQHMVNLILNAMITIPANHTSLWFFEVWTTQPLNFYPTCLLPKSSTGTTCSIDSTLYTSPCVSPPSTHTNHSNASTRSLSPLLLILIILMILLEIWVLLLLILIILMLLLEIWVRLLPILIILMLLLKVWALWLFFYSF